MEACPKCSKRFRAPKARGGYATLTIFRGGLLDTKVRCPGCGHIFEGRTGLLGPLGLKLLVSALLLGALALVLYLMLLKPLLQ